MFEARSINHQLSTINQFAPPCLSSYRASFVNSHSSVRVRPGAPAFALRASARQAIFQGRDVTVSIFACDADCAGANPVALTISVFDGPFVVGYRTPNETERGCSSTAIERPDASSGDAGSRPAFRFLSHSTFCPSSFSDGPLSLGYR